MAFDIKEDGEVMAEALCDSFLQGRDPFIRELVSESVICCRVKFPNLFKCQIT